ncbi:hypothetical protein NIA71_08210 [Ihubacter massiliensis]|uniref:hypothetical protein n=1 Tax=Ihubacter massiliensis TaxID=1852367 RepID=UPI0020985742|nr:hypothetical protein [Ihubacter massiliensis]MCO7121933.1 hypothetical protein [Ihubacter massiliensis]
MSNLDNLKLVTIHTSGRVREVSRMDLKMKYRYKTYILQHLLSGTKHGIDHRAMSYKEFVKFVKLVGCERNGD